ncbi:MAG: MBL fold metallo-hydrolase [Candidatus Obscuribacterales bacterium]|nr:MBL fold metallo-hydrolase [Candidatus Obscuribacterales bacterium]
MFVTLYGAAKEVTGSCYLVETNSATVLVDCGLFQGPPRLERLNRIPKSFASKHFDAVVLTHAHLDHCGRLPLLCNSGYRGPIYATKGTIDLATLILEDAAKIQEDDCKRANKKRKLAGIQALRPLFTIKDVQRVQGQFRELDYEHWLDIAPGMRIRLVEAGHILGSASVDMMINQNGGRRRLVFSGDLGQWNMPIVRDPATLDSADIIFVESTYGNREHRSLQNTILEFQELIRCAVEKNGKILIPTFAVGRTQQLLYHLSEMFRNEVIDPFPIYLDSPMAIEATRLYKSHPELMDKETRELFEQNSGLLDRTFGLRTCTTSDQSKALNAVPGPCLIMAGAGMCDAGRILHHFRQNLPLAETVVIIVGYQSKGSLGRNLIEGANSVKIFGEAIPVRATIKSLGGFSAHAGRSDLLRWLEPMTRHKQHPRIIVTHGEHNVMNAFAQDIQATFGIQAEIPGMGELIQC